MIVLDSSALLALLNQEPGAENLSADLLTTSICSTVNIAEVHTKLVMRGMTQRDAWTAAVTSVHEIVDFTMQQAKQVGDLAAETRSIGLSLGDRACLALAMELGVPVYTADRAWKRLRLPVQIHSIR